MSQLQQPVAHNKSNTSAISMIIWVLKSAHLESRHVSRKLNHARLPKRPRKHIASARPDIKQEMKGQQKVNKRELGFIQHSCFVPGAILFGKVRGHRAIVAMTRFDTHVRKSNGRSWTGKSYFGKFNDYSVDSSTIKQQVFKVDTSVIKSTHRVWPFEQGRAIIEYDRQEYFHTSKDNEKHMVLRYDETIRRLAETMIKRKIVLLSIHFCPAEKPLIGAAASLLMRGSHWWRRGIESKWANFVPFLYLSLVF